jgi:hypothetical protein
LEGEIASVEAAARVVACVETDVVRLAHGCEVGRFELLEEF